jgi:hypothetical protein
MQVQESVQEVISHLQDKRGPLALLWTFLPDHGLDGLWNFQEAQEIEYDMHRLVVSTIKTAKGSVAVHGIRHGMWVQKLGVWAQHLRTERPSRVG